MEDCINLLTCSSYKLVMEKTGVGDEAWKLALKEGGKNYGFELQTELPRVGVGKVFWRVRIVEQMRYSFS